MKKERADKILFVGGGTLGPVTPLLAVMEEVKRRRLSTELVFVGTSVGPERRLVEAAGHRFIVLDGPKLRRYLDSRNLRLPFDLLAAIGRAR
jgi:UDP-N-acetylglucosamine:LPS N-acetylglucosamine transferase